MFYFLIDWLDVANDLLRSCHINQHIKHLSECGADVFVHLYESILGEKVPGGNDNFETCSLFFVSVYFVMNKLKFAKLNADSGFLKYLHPSKDKRVRLFFFKKI